MGSPNFSITTGSNEVLGLAWGLTPAYPTDEAVQEELDSGEWGDDVDTDDIREDLYQINADEVSDLYGVIQRVVQAINDEACCMWERSFDWDIFPYEVSLEQGYHAGFSVGIVDKLGCSQWFASPKYSEEVWDDHVRYNHKVIEVELSYADYWKAADKVGEFMQWAINQMARCYGLKLITGRGYTQGEADYDWDEYEPHDQAFKWLERYPHFNYKLSWSVFGDYQAARDVGGLRYRLDVAKAKPVWSVWVGGGEVNDYYCSWYEAHQLAAQYRADGYDDVAIKLNKVGV